MKRAILYYHTHDVDVEKLISELSAMCKKYSMDFLPLNIDEVEDGEKLMIKTTPALVVGPYSLKFPFTIRDAEIAISAASARAGSSKKVNLRKARAKNRTGIFLARFYPSLIALIVLVFVGGAFLAPVLKMAGKERASSFLYGFYRIFCHQLAFRSYFIGGEQLFYPRDLAHIDGVVSYEVQFNDPFDDVTIARGIEGDEHSGYKIALCERDLAIYASIALVAILFQVGHRRWKPLKWYWWIIFGLFPIALDGFSQIPGLSAGWPAWFPVRESTPLLRTLTGMLFGGMTARYMFPLMEESMSDTYQQLILQRSIIKAASSELAHNETD